MWSWKAQTSKEVSHFNLSLSSNRAIFLYLFGKEFSFGNHAPSCSFKFRNFGKFSWSVMHGTAKAIKLVLE